MSDKPHNQASIKADYSFDNSKQVDTMEISNCSHIR